MDQHFSGTPAVPGNPGRGRGMADSPGEAENVASSIERAVRRETGENVTALHVEVSRHRVLLNGRCNSYYTKQKAQHAAMEISGGRELTNRIEVR